MTRPAGDGRLHFARGWYVVAYSDDLQIGAVEPLSYFDADQVLVRMENGVAAVFDAHCPHLGAHIGHGGKIDNGAIVCPFHGWRYSAIGDCLAVPGGHKIPQKAKLKPWPTQEINGLVLVHFPPDQASVTSPIPPIPDYGSPGFLPWQGRATRRIRALAADIVENMADLSHFEVVHGTALDPATAKLTIDGETASMAVEGFVDPPFVPVRSPLRSVSTYSGPAYEISAFEGDPAEYVLVAHTPLTLTQMDLRFAMFTANTASTQKIDQVIRSLGVGLEADFPIWEHKIRLARPLLSGADRYITTIRRWYDQFFFQ